MSSDAPITTLRFALRTAVAFSLELLQLYRGERSFTDAVIVATLIQCNTASVAGHAELRRRYAGFDTPPPADLRRPISVNALATSLGLPFETVRRRVKQLVAEGVCETTPLGVRFADQIVGAEIARQLLDRCFQLVRQLYEQLRRVGGVGLMHLPGLAAPDFPAGAAPVRIVWRAAADYFLRMMELLQPSFDSLTLAFIVLEVGRVNTQWMPDAMLGVEAIDPDALARDLYHRPARGAVVAANLGLPHETVRRNLALLIAQGRIQRVREGFVVPTAAFAHPQMTAAATANFNNLARMFAELAETGVLALWDPARTVHNVA